MDQMLRYGRMVLIGLVLLLFAGCGGSDGLFVDCHIFDENGDQVVETDVGVGETFEVKLCVKRNRGYRWSDTPQIMNPAVIQEISRAYEPGHSSMGGTAGHEIWAFRALEPGTAVIRMDHQQLSGRNTEGVWTYQLTVNVTQSVE